MSGPQREWRNIDSQTGSSPEKASGNSRNYSFSLLPVNKDYSMSRPASRPTRTTYGRIHFFNLALSTLMLCASAAGSLNAQSFDQLAARAQAAMDANQTQTAILLYQRAIALRPSWSEGWWELGTMFFDAGQLTQARDAFLHFVSVEQEQPGPGFGMLGLTEFRLGEYQDALTALERGRTLGLGTNPAFVRAVLEHDGILYNLFGQPEIALVRLTLVANQIAAANPNMPEDAVLNNNELLDAFGLAALRIPELPANLAPHRVSLVQQAGHAQALVALQDRVAAGAEMKQLVARYPSVPNVHYMYGVYLLKEDPPAAVNEFRQELVVSPKNPAAHIQLALEYLRVSDYKQGLKFAQQAIVLAPDNFVAHVACGELWMGLGNTDHALRELRTAVKLSPGSPDAHFQLSRALAAAGQNRKAARQRAEFERLKSLSVAADKGNK